MPPPYGQQSNQTQTTPLATHQVIKSTTLVVDPERTQPSFRGRRYIEPTHANLQAALTFIPVSDRDGMVLIAASIKAALDESGRELFEDWICPFLAHKQYEKHKHIYNLPTKQRGAGHLIKTALSNGWIPDGNQQQPTKPPYTPDPRKAPKEGGSAESLIVLNEIIRLAEPHKADAVAHAYLREKGISGAGALTLDVAKIPNDSPLWSIAPLKYETDKELRFRNQGKFLVVPLVDLRTSAIGSVEIINNESRGRNKTQLAGISSGNLYAAVNYTSGTEKTIVITEGYATAVTFFDKDNSVDVIATLGVGKLKQCALIVRELNPDSPIIIAGDNDADGIAQQIAYEAAQSVEGSCRIPPVASRDWNDIHTEKAYDQNYFDKAFITEYIHQYPEIVEPNTPILDEAYTVVSDFDNVLTIDAKYQGTVLVEEMKRHKVIANHSQMGTGKTTSIVAAIREVLPLAPSQALLYVSPRTWLNKAIENEEGLNFKLFAKDSKKLSKDDYQQVAVTPISCSELADSLNDHRLTPKLIIFDESNELSRMLTGKLPKNIKKIITALRDLCEDADNIIFMDAMFNDYSRRLMDVLGVRDNVRFITNVFQPLKDHTLRIISPKDSTHLKRGKILAREICISLRQGNDNYICSSSTGFITDTFRSIKELRLDKNPVHIASKKVTNRSKVEIKDTEKLLGDPKNNTKLFGTILCDPSAAVGISLNAIDHTNKAFGIFPNNEYTGGYEQAIQLLGRVRNLMDKEWLVVLDNEKEVYGIIPTVEQAVAAIMIRQEWGSGWGEAVDEQLTDDIAKFKALNDISDKEDKNNFNENFINHAKQIGIKVIIDRSEIDFANTELTETKKRLTEEQKLLVKHLKTNSRRISQAEYYHLKALARFNGNSHITEEEWGATLKYEIENNYIVNLDTLTEDEIKEVLDLDHKGGVFKLMLREAVTAGDEYKTEYKAALSDGVGHKSAFKVDIFNDKKAFELKIKLYSYPIEVIKEGSAYSRASLANSGFESFLRANKEKLAQANIINLPEDYRKRLETIMTKLLKVLGYEVKSKQVRVNKTKQKIRKVKRHEYLPVCDVKLEALGDMRVTNQITVPDVFFKLKKLYENAKEGEKVTLPNNAPDAIPDTDFELFLTDSETNRERLKATLRKQDKGLDADFKSETASEVKRELETEEKLRIMSDDNPETKEDEKVRLEKTSAAFERYTQKSAEIEQGKSNKTVQEIADEYVQEMSKIGRPESKQSE